MLQLCIASLLSLQIFFERSNETVCLLLLARLESNLLLLKLVLLVVEVVVLEDELVAVVAELPRKEES